MDLFGVFVCALFVAEASSARNSLGSCPLIKIKYGRVRYKARGKIARFLCNTGYILAGDKYSTCLGNGNWDTALFPKCVRATCQDAKPPKNGLIFPSHRGAVLNFYCKSGFQLRGAAVSYCDGLRWDRPLPACLPTNTTPPLSCDFEQEDICGWNHDLNHDFDWRRMKHSTPSGHIGTGPSFDHTKGAGQDGYYMYIESSARNVNDTARLISPVYDKTDTVTCFEFYYHMFGVATGSLRVYLKRVSEALDMNVESALFVKNGNQGNKWYRELIVLGAIDEEYQIIIEGVRGSSYVSDIAIDDVRIIKDCSPELELRGGETTTEEPTSSELPMEVESCENRCNTNDTRTYPSLLACDCDERCYERSRCCPDYFDFCLTGTSGDDFVDETTESLAAETGRTRQKTPAATTSRPATTLVLVAAPSSNGDVAEVPRLTTTEDETPAAPIKEAEAVTEYRDSDKIFDRQKIEVAQNVGEGNLKTVVFGVGVVFGVLFAMVGTAFLARRYRLCRCDRMRLNHASNGDSQSDVRFLTSDEIIDFTLPSDYATL